MVPTDFGPSDNHDAVPNDIAADSESHHVLARKDRAIDAGSETESRGSDEAGDRKRKKSCSINDQLSLLWLSGGARKYADVERW